MKVIVGLGNIGKEYEKTRHNIGFMVVDELAKRWQVTSWQNKWQAEIATCFLPQKVLLVKPTTYMNLSGNAVREIAKFYNISPHEIAVIQDDLDLPCGKIRIRRKGSAGGHNGIRSLIQNLGSEDFARFRIGIGHPDKDRKKVVNYVLEPFNKEEQQLIQTAITVTAEALELFLKEDIDLVMNRFNKK